MDETLLLNTTSSRKKNQYGIRQKLLTFVTVAGLGTPVLMWILALAGVRSDDFPTDKAATSMVLLTIYCPLLAFLNNAGEKRSFRDQLIDFAWLWFFSNTGYQLFWELPWFLLKNDIMKGLDEDQPGYWPWWAYARADRRYMQHNDLTVAISGMDAAIALVECCICYLYFKNYKIITTWLAALLAACLAWGQFYFYLGEIYNNFDNIHDGWFGLYVKYGVMNIPWCVFCFPQAAGFMWSLAMMYKRRGVEEYLKTSNLQEFNKFSNTVDLFLLVDDNGNQQTQETLPKWVRRMSIFMFVWPWIFIIIDSTIYRIQNF